MKKVMELLEEAKNGSVRSLGRLISLVENEAEGTQKVLKTLYPHTGKARVIGVTGPPGVGKSTLVGHLVEKYFKKKYSVGILAIDPSSPISGGSFLGDRIRMSFLPPTGDIFIRSLSSRSSQGGISQATMNIVRVLDAIGRDIIIIETVGAGQGEVEVVNIADTIILVLAPGFGDEIQALKAGIMEVADIFVVNKADQPQAFKYIHTLETMIHNLSSNRLWLPPVVKTVALQSEGIEMLIEKVDEHWFFLQKDDSFIHLKKGKIYHEVLRLAEQKIRRELKAFFAKRFDRNAFWEKMVNSGKDPYGLAEEIVSDFLKSQTEAFWKNGEC